MKQFLRYFIILTASASLAHADSGLITFEPNDNGKLPNNKKAKDERKIRNDFQSSFGVTFGQDVNGDLQIDPGSYALLDYRVHNKKNPGFYSDSNWTYNQAASGYQDQLGDWFLKSAAYFEGAAENTILISFDNPTAAVSGEMWDIDAYGVGNYEQWKVAAYDSAGNELAALESPAGRDSWYESGSLDSKPWTWSFDMAGVAEISTLALHDIGVFGSPGVLNNFNVSAANSSADAQYNAPVDAGDEPSMGSPEASFSILAASFLILGAAQRKRPW